MKKAETLKFKKQSIIVVPYAYKVNFVVTGDVNRYVDWKHPELSGTKQLACHIYEGAESWIVLPEKASIDTIVHEVWHCVRRIMMYIHAELENEVIAYLMGWMTEKVVQFLWKNDPGYGQGYFEQESAKSKAKGRKRLKPDKMSK